MCVEIVMDLKHIFLLCLQRSFETVTTSMNVQRYNRRNACRSPCKVTVKPTQMKPELERQIY
jgi:hypothetical protein